MRFTAEQQRAIDVRGRELLVSAAAGSGKTAVLVERIIKLITDSKKPVDIDRLLVVTFTEAAAAEMRERISERLHDLRSNAPDDENIRRQQLLLPRAQISTIHKFCAGVIRRCFHLTELDPGFKIADETEVRLLKNQILDELFEEQYEGDDMFFELVDLYGGGKTKDKGLHDLVLEISGFISGFPWPERWLTRACEMYDTDDINATPWAAALRFEIEHRLAGVAAAIEYGMRLASTGAEKYLDALRSDMDAVERLRAHTDDFARFREELFSIIPAKLTSITAKDEFDPEIKERV
ncbi:MAG: UvrD-helicase domain-containing protein, partial [Defluviitaleaceae bacterium]|nr:UvrD-helicase domain-containing protein [Defluviitaleaceae bacterium]